MLTEQVAARASDSAVSRSTERAGVLGVVGSSSTPPKPHGACKGLRRHPPCVDGRHSSRDHGAPLSPPLSGKAESCIVAP